MRKHRWRYLLLALVLLVAAAGGFEWWTGFVRGRLARSDGLQRYQQNDYAAAVEAFDRAIAVWPNHAESYMDRANARYKLDDVEGALADGDRAVELDPNYPLFRTLTASRYDARGQKRPVPGELDGAIADFRRAHELVPREDDYRKRLAAAHARRAGVRHQAGQRDDAIADFLESVKLEPEDAGVLKSACAILTGRGMGRLSQGDVAGADADLTRALNLNDRLAVLAEADRRVIGRPRAADPAAVAETAASLYTLRAQVRGKQGDWARAEADLTRAIATGVNTAGLHRERGLARLRQKRADLAEPDFEIYRQAFPGQRAALDAEIEKIRPGER